MPRIEKDIEDKYVYWVVKVQKELCIKLLGMAGLPDRMIIGKGRLIFFIEFKMPGKYPTKIQKYMHNILRGFGFNVYICKSVEEAKKAYKEERAACDNGAIYS